MVASTLLALLGAAASAGGSIAAMQRNRQTENDLLGQRSDIERELYEGALEGAGARAYLKELDRGARANMRGIENSVVSTGSTSENRLAQMNSVNELVDKAAGNLLQREEADRRYLFGQRSNANTQLGNLRAEQAQNWMNIAQNVAKTAGALGETYLDSDSPLLGGGGGSEAEPSTYLQDKMAAEGAGKASDYLKEQQAKLDASIPKPSADNVKPITDSSPYAPDVNRLRNPSTPAVNTGSPLDSNIVPLGDDSAESFGEDDPRRKRYSQA